MWRIRKLLSFNNIELSMYAFKRDGLCEVVTCEAVDDNNHVMQFYTDKWDSVNIDKMIGFTRIETNKSVIDMFVRYTDVQWKFAQHMDVAEVLVGGAECTLYPQIDNYLRIPEYIDNDGIHYDKAGYNWGSLQAYSPSADLFSAYGYHVFDIITYRRKYIQWINDYEFLVGYHNKFIKYRVDDEFLKLYAKLHLVG